MTRSRSCAASLVLALSLAHSAQAQGSPAPTPPPETAPSGAAPLALLADAIVEARKSKVLERRLLAPRYLIRPNARGGPFFVEVSGRRLKVGMRLEVQITLFTEGQDRTFVAGYTFDEAGVLRSFDVENPEETMRAVIKGERLSITVEREGAPRLEKTEAWKPHSLPHILSLFILPRVADQGLPKRFEAVPYMERNLAYSEPLTWTREPDETLSAAGGKPSETPRAEKAPSAEEKPSAEKTPSAAGAKGQRLIVYAYRGGTRATFRLYADGPNKGQLAEVARRREGDSYFPKSAAEFKALKATIPLIKREGKVVGVLAGLATAQLNHRSQHSKFADEISDLVAKDVRKQILRGYEVLVRVSPDGTQWIAVAVPEIAGKTGRYYFVTNSDGQVFRSEKEIPLKDDCQIPKGLVEAFP